MYLLGLIFMILLLIIYKVPFLSLPYYWDEASPYAVAIHTMFKNGISLLPSALPPDLSRGHPLVFHSLTALWMHAFGTSLFASHSFALLVTVLTVITVWYFCDTFFSRRVAFIAALLLCSQAILISQACFLLPESIMALWTMLCFTTWMKGRKLLFVLVATAMLLTKESGLVLLFALGLTELLTFRKSNGNAIKELTSSLAALAVPVVIAFLFFVAQKITYGWFLFPLHTGYISSNWTSFTSNLPSAAAYLVIYYGRNGFTFFVLLSLIFITVKRQIRLTENEKRALYAITSFIVCYLLFSSVNFYIPRYLLCVFPPFVIAGSVVINKALHQFRAIFPLIIIGISSTCLYFYIHQRAGGDNDYRPSIKVALEMVRCCEQKQLQNQKILAPCVVRINLSQPFAGYLSGSAFTGLQAEVTPETAYYITSSDEFDKAEFDRISSGYNLTLLRKFEYDYAWVSLYQLVRK